MTKVIRRSLSRAYMQAHMNITVDENDKPICVTFVSYTSPIISIDLQEYTLYFYPTKVNCSRTTASQSSLFARDILPFRLGYYYLKQMSVNNERSELYITDEEQDYICRKLKWFIEHGKNIKY